MDALLRELTRPLSWQTGMRKGPTDSTPEIRRRPRSAPQGEEPARAGIRSLDCGDEMSADERVVIRREAKDSAPLPEQPDSGRGTSPTP